MPNLFKIGDKVLTKIKGVEVEGTVRRVWDEEVQVRTPDNVLRWRTTKTVRALETASTSEAVIGGPAPDEPTVPMGPIHDVPAKADGGDDNMTHQNQPVSEPPTSEASPTQADPITPAIEYAPCGVPEAMADRKRSKKKGRRK